MAIDPVAWEAPEAPALRGDYAANDALAAIERLGSELGSGPEDVAVDGAGRIYAGMADGRVVRLDAEGGGAKDFARTGGRPLGLDFDAAGNLIVADASKGLLSIAPDGAVTTLSTGAGGVPFRLTDDVDVAPDGTIYFSDASSKFTFEDYVSDLMEHRGNGRLLAYDPEAKATRVLLDGLHFANGVAVSPDGAFVLVNETGSYRVLRYWLAGPGKGTAEVFIDNLPGFPDGISTGTGGLFWLALVSPRDPAVEALSPYPALRRVVMRLPKALHPAPKRFSFILGLDSEGRVVHNLQDRRAGYTSITSVEEHGGHLYLGSLSESTIARIARP